MLAAPGPGHASGPLCLPGKGRTGQEGGRLGPRLGGGCSHSCTAICPQSPWAAGQNDREDLH